MIQFHFVASPNLFFDSLECLFFMQQAVRKSRVYCRQKKAVQPGSLALSSVLFYSSFRNPEVIFACKFSWGLAWSNAL